MKKVLLILSFLISTVLVNAQGTVNPSFETWTAFSTSGGVGEYPTGWTTSDSLTKANGGVESAWKGTDSYDGTYCLHLKSSLIVYSGINVAGPAVATNGIVALSGLSLAFSGGNPDTARARFYSGRYKYAPIPGSNDSGTVAVHFLKRNGNNRDTIATGIVSLAESATYSQFMVMMEFRDFVTQPDTALIIIQSAKGGLVPFATSVNESELTIDSLNATGFVGVEELQGDVKSFNVFPSPASSVITFDAEVRNQTALSYDIFDQTGRWLLSGKMSSSKETIDISQLAVGNYVVKLNSNGKTVTAKQFSVSR